MKHRIGYTGSALLLAIALLGITALAEDKPASAQSEPSMEEMMKKMEAAGTPGEGHKTLDPLVGDWNAEVKLWMSPDAPPSVTKARAKSIWVMNGRFVEEKFDGEFMGKPFHGMSLTGYDNMKKKFTTVWVDDASTAMVTSEGEASDGGKVITLEGRYDCPMTDEKNLAMKQVIRIISRDKHVFEMHDLRKGENSKTMEITYTRR